MLHLHLGNFITFWKNPSLTNRNIFWAEYHISLTMKTKILSICSLLTLIYFCFFTSKKYLG